MTLRVADDVATEWSGDFRQELFDARILLPTSTDGVYLRSERFERVVRGVDAAVSAEGSHHRAEVLHFPLVTSSDLLRRTGYLRSFPDLAGVVHGFDGLEREHAAIIDALEQDSGDDWARTLGPTGLALCSAACHPLYESQEGVLPAGGRVVEVFGQCFRHEPSTDPARMQTFRQHEFVYLGDEPGARRHRDAWISRALALHRRLGLDVAPVVANDPFFGRAGEILANSQLADALKVEIVAPISRPDAPTAITSANCHLEHFGAEFGINSSDGSVAHTACVGFGVERIALALFSRHGLDLERWDGAVATALRL